MSTWLGLVAVNFGWEYFSADPDWMLATQLSFANGLGILAYWLGQRWFK